jgi:hypothetical protein
MKSFFIPLVLMFALAGCGNATSSSESQDKEYQRQVKAFDAQTKKTEEQSARYDKLLERWEKQTDQYDRILDKLEHQATKSK